MANSRETASLVLGVQVLESGSVRDCKEGREWVPGSQHGSEVETETHREGEESNFHEEAGGSRAFSLSPESLHRRGSSQRPLWRNTPGEQSSGHSRLQRLVIYPGSGVPLERAAGW